MTRGSRDEARHVKGISLATKLAISISVCVAAFMLGFGLFLNGFIRSAILDSVKDTAIEAARTAAITDYSAWDPYAGTRYEGMSSKRISEIRASFATSEQLAREFLTPEERRRYERNRTMLQRAVVPGSSVLAVELLSANLTGVIMPNSLGQDQTEFAPVRRDEAEALEQEGVAEGLLTLDGRRVRVVRGSHPIRDEAGEVRAVVGVYIDAQAIDDASGRLLRNVMLSALVFIVIGAGVSVIVGRRVAAPLKLLKEDIRIVASGDLEHRTKPHSSDEIGELARAFERMTRSLEEGRELERAQQRARHEMLLAGEVTGRLFPEELPAIEGYAVAAHHERAGDLSGEYYDAVELPDGRAAFTVAAASGKGVPAAMVMAMARSALHAVGRAQTAPDEILREVNALMARDLERGMYVSVIIGVLDPRAHVLRVANAGHSPLLRHHAREGRLALVHGEGIALGFDEGPVFDRTLKVVDVPLEEGDRVVFYTPDILKTSDPDGRELGEKRFATIVKSQLDQPAGPFVRRVAALLKKFRGGAAPDRDVTLLAIDRQG